MTVVTHGTPKMPPGISGEHLVLDEGNKVLTTRFIGLAFAMRATVAGVRRLLPHDRRLAASLTVTNPLGGSCVLNMTCFVKSLKVVRGGESSLGYS